MLACGIPLWPVTYADLNFLQRPAFVTWLVLGVLAAVIASLLLPRRVLAPVGAVTFGFVLAVLARVVVEVTLDPTSHNLWPFEVVIAGGVGLLAAVIGVAGTRLAEQMRSGPRR